MKDIWRILEACHRNKMMIRFAAWPGGSISVAIYNSPEQSEQFLYEGKNGDLDAVGAEMMKDWKHLLSSPHPLSPPPPPIFPKPPGVR